MGAAPRRHAHARLLSASHAARPPARTARLRAGQGRARLASGRGPATRRGHARLVWARGAQREHEQELSGCRSGGGRGPRVGAPQACGRWSGADPLAGTAGGDADGRCVAAWGRGAGCLVPGGRSGDRRRWAEWVGGVETGTEA